MTLKLPPAIVGLAFLFGIAAAPSVWPEAAWQWPRALRGSAAIVLLLLSTAVAVSAAVQFLRAGTTVDPLHPDRSTSLITTGVYRVSRNPMYLGFVLTLLAAAVWLAHPVSLVLVPVFALVLDRFQIRGEEVALRAHFGERFDDYCRRVRRWI